MMAEDRAQMEGDPSQLREFEPYERKSGELKEEKPPRGTSPASASWSKAASDGAAEANGGETLAWGRDLRALCRPRSLAMQAERSPTRRGSGHPPLHRERLDPRSCCSLPSPPAAADSRPRAAQSLSELPERAGQSPLTLDLPARPSACLGPGVLARLPGSPEQRGMCPRRG